MIGAGVYDMKREWGNYFFSLEKASEIPLSAFQYLQSIVTNKT